MEFGSVRSVFGRFLFAVVFLVFFNVVYAEVWNGTTNLTWLTNNISKDTIYINTAEEFAGFLTINNFANYTNSLKDKTIKLKADIMLNDTSASENFPSGWKDWTATKKPTRTLTIGNIAIGNIDIRAFQGTFDGDGHIVSGIYINNNADYQGLFKFLHKNGTIKNLGIVASYIKGGNYTGGLVGFNKGAVINSFSIGTKVESNTDIQYAGGLLGINMGTLENCYSTGKVIDPTGYPLNFNGGALVGKDSSGTVINSYYDKITSEAIRTIGNDFERDDGKTTQEIQNQTFVEDFNLAAGLAFANKWAIGNRPDFGNYPTLLNELAFNILEDSFASGNGKEANPYIINESIHLKNLSDPELLIKVKGFKGYYFKLAEDIAFNPWVPIGTKENPFNGNFEGNGKIISGISTNQTLSYQGLFGYIGSSGTVKNVRVIANIKGKDYVGGIAGYNEGEISNSYFNGDVSGANYVGGIAGENAKTINSSYSNGNVSGANYVGGFAGKNSGSIRVAYSTGTVTGTKNVGGFIGSNCESCRIISGYYDKDLNSGLSDHGGEGKATEEMKSEGFVKELNNVATLFSMKKWTTSEGSYPALGDAVSAYDIKNYFSESGTAGEPYLINTPKQLEYVSLLMEFKNLNFNGKYFKLESDILLNPSINFTPIGTEANKFQGTFDGDGKTISGIYINSNARYIGLFGYVSSGMLKNIKITDSYVEGDIYVGGLAGYATSNIDNCSFSGTVKGASLVGGLIGSLQNAKISNSYSTGTVSGSKSIGGLLGTAYIMFDETTIENSYSTSTVTGNENVGGLVGVTARTTINNSYSTGTVTGNIRVGGLVGSDENSVERQISNSYSTGMVTGKTNVGGLIGWLSETKINSSYSTGAVSGDNIVGGLVGMKQSEITNSYSTGLVTKTSGTTTANFGGLVGRNALGRITNSYYDNTINSGFEDSQGKSTTELKTKTSSIYADWDFSTLWDIDEEEQNKANNGYPYHHWGYDRLKCVANNYKIWKGWECGNKQQIPVPELAEAKFEYNSTEHTAELSLENEAYTLTGNKGTKAKEYKAVVALKDKENTVWENGSSADLELPWEIEKAIIPIPVLAEAKFTFEDKEHSARIEEHEAYTITGNKGKDANEYIAIVSLKDKENTVWENGLFADIEFEWEIEQAGMDFPTHLLEVVYEPSLTFEQLALPHGYTWNAEGTILVAGIGQSQSATYKDPSGNYKEVTGIITVHVLKANPDYVIPTNLTAISGQTLASVGLTGGWEWENAETPVGDAGENTHQAKFTPSDTANYKILSGIDVKISVTEPPLMARPHLANMQIKARATSNAIVIENLPANSKAELYDLQGKLLFTSEKSGIIPVQAKGMYIIKVSLGSETKTLRITVM
jgi:hypothetical protein